MMNAATGTLRWLAGSLVIASLVSCSGTPTGSGTGPGNRPVAVPGQEINPPSLPNAAPLPQNAAPSSNVTFNDPNIRTVLAARPEVFNHNIETVRRLHRSMRGAKASYDKALWLLGRAKELADYPVLTKSGIIVGLGETNDEIVETMRDLRAHGVDVVTIGQYLQPSPKHAAIDRWVHPDEFRWLREQGEALGFGSVFAGPLVRSSYRADEQRHAAETGRGAVAY
jgi:hypothetical protein